MGYQAPKQIVVRRGKRYYEYRMREENDSKFRTTTLECFPACNKPAKCKWCDGIKVGQFLLSFPIGADVKTGTAMHMVTPPNACHIIAYEWCQQNPNVRLDAGWLLTDEEVAAGKTGIEWPDEL
jgi:hypothetical protein